MANPTLQAMPRVMRVVPRNRNIEALLLFFVFGINAFELSQIQLSTIEVLRADFWLYWTPLTAVALVVHGILRAKASEADSLLLPIAVFLNGLGIAEIYRLDLAKKYNILQTPTTLVLDSKGRVRSRIGGLAKPQVIQEEAQKATFEI